MLFRFVLITILSKDLMKVFTLFHDYFIMTESLDVFYLFYIVSRLVIDD